MKWLRRFGRVDRTGLWVHGSVDGARHRGWAALQCRGSWETGRRAGTAGSGGHASVRAPLERGRHRSGPVRLEADGAMAYQREPAACRQQVPSNRPSSAWELYRLYRTPIIGGTLLILLQSAFIVALLIQRAGRRRVERALRESEERFRLMADTAPGPGVEDRRRRRRLRQSPVAAVHRAHRGAGVGRRLAGRCLAGRSGPPPRDIRHGV